MAADKLAVANLMAVELQARNTGHDRLEQRLTLKKRQACRVAAVEVHEVESIKNKTRAALPVSRCGSAAIGDRLFGAVEARQEGAGGVADFVGDHRAVGSFELEGSED